MIRRCYSVDSHGMLQMINRGDISRVVSTFQSKQRRRQQQQQQQQQPTSYSDYEMLLRATAMVGDLKVTKAIVERMQAEGHVLQPKTQTTVLNAFRRSNATDDVASLFDALRSQEHLTRGAWDVRINSATSAQEAFGTFTAMPLKKDARIYATTIMKCTGNLALVNQIWQSFKNDGILKESTPAQLEQLYCAYIVAVCGSVLRNEQFDVDALQHDVRKLALDVAHVWDLIRTLALTPSTDRPLAFLSTTRLSSLVQDKSLVLKLLSAGDLLNEGDRTLTEFQSVLMTLSREFASLKRGQSITELDVQPAASASSVSTTSSSSEASTSAVATTTSTKLDEDTLTREINWLLSRLPAVSLKLHEPDVVVFNALVHLLVLAGKLDTAQAVMHRVMPLYGARPDTVTYNVLIRGFVRDGQIDEAFRATRAMLADGRAADAYTFASLYQAVNKAANAGRSRAALLALMHSVESLRLSSDVRFTLPMYNSYLTACNRVGMNAVLDSALAELAALGLRPDVWTFNALLTSTAGSMKRNARFFALSLFDQMKQQQASEVKPDVVTFNILLKLCRDDADLCDTLYRQLKTAGLTPDVVTFGALLKSYQYAINVRDDVIAARVAGVVREMAERRVPPNAIVYGAIVKTLLRIGQFNEALATIDKMTRAGFDIDHSVAAALVLYHLRLPVPDVDAALQVVAKYAHLRYYNSTIEEMATLFAANGRHDVASRLRSSSRN